MMRLESPPAEDFEAPRFRDPRIRQGGGGDDDDEASGRGGKIRQERIAPPKVKEQEEEKVEENYVSVKYNGTTVDVMWSPGDDVSTLKERIEEVLGLESSQLKIVFEGATLQDEDSLDELDLEEDSELEVVAGLFAQMAGMSRVAFAVDLSGSMSASVGQGHTQMSVVQDHLRRCIRSLKGEGCQIGIATFTSSSQLPLGPAMVRSSSQMDDALKAVDNMRASGGNGGSGESAVGWKRKGGRRGAGGRRTLLLVKAAVLQELEPVANPAREGTRSKSLLNTSDANKPKPRPRSKSTPEGQGACRHLLVLLSRAGGDATALVFCDLCVQRDG